MRKIWLFFVLVILSMTLFGAKLADLPDVVRPFQLTVDGDRIYVSASSTVYMFSMKDFKSLGQFGKQGEGPGEFISRPVLSVYPDSLTIESWGKFMVFSRDGVYKNETRIPASTMNVSQLGEFWVARATKPDEKDGIYYNTVNIYDKDFTLVKNLYKEKSLNVQSGVSDSGKINWPAFTDFMVFKVYNGNTYIGDSSKGFFIEVFDDKGNKLYEIDRKYEKMKVSDEFKDRHMKMRQSASNWERMKDRVNIVFPEYLPPFAEFRVQEGKIYVFTHVKKDKNQEMVVLDLKGNELNRVFLPANLPDNQTCCIYKDNFYFLSDNEEKEMIELHVVPIK